MYDVTALGELLIDFTPCGVSDQGNVCFERNPGGAPANVAAALARFDKKTAFLGKVGKDEFGLFLQRVLEDLRIDTTGLVLAEETNTPLAFVHLDAQGDRSFSFYRKMTADLLLSGHEIDKEIIRSSRIFHFGSVSMTHEPAASATLEAAEYARSSHVLVSFDPNLRVSLWDSLEHAKARIVEGLKLADIVKLSEEELEFLTGTSDVQEGSAYLWESYRIPLIFITLGAEGSCYRKGSMFGCCEGYKVSVVDTTGAGDAFMGGALNQIMELGKPIHEMTQSNLESVIRFANAAGALAATRKGAINSMPVLEEIEALMVLNVEEDI